jgi:3-methyladenine DNA glycosylase AlkD
MENLWFRRAGFVLMARLAVSDKQAENHRFDPFFPLVREYATDDRNLVKKAVNWALRQMGKRNPVLHGKCIDLAEELQRLDSKAARWIASDALRELRSPRIRERIAHKFKV